MNLDFAQSSTVVLPPTPILFTPGLPCLFTTLHHPPQPNALVFPTARILHRPGLDRRVEGELESFPYIIQLRNEVDKQLEWHRPWSLGVCLRQSRTAAPGEDDLRRYGLL